MRLYWTRVAPHPAADTPTRSGNVDTGTHRENGAEAEIGVMRPQAREHRGPPTASSWCQARSGPSLGTPSRNLLRPEFRTWSFQKPQGINSRSYGPTDCGRNEHPPDTFPGRHSFRASCPCWGQRSDGLVVEILGNTLER